MPAVSYSRRVAELILELDRGAVTNESETERANFAMQRAHELIATYERATGGNLNEATCQMILDALRGDYRIPPEA